MARLKLIRQIPVIAAAITYGAGLAVAQTDLLPTYAYDTVAEISMATTAAKTCDGAVLKNRKLEKTMLELMGRLTTDGLDPVQSMQHFETEVGLQQVASREAELRLRHGVDPKGVDALCSALRAEVKVNKSLAKLVKLR